MDSGIGDSGPGSRGQRGSKTPAILAAVAAVSVLMTLISRSWFELDFSFLSPLLLYGLGTLVMVAAALTAARAVAGSHFQERRGGPSKAGLVIPYVLGSLAVVAFGLDHLARKAFSVPIDPWLSADMLVQIRLALNALLTGHNPYQTFHVPWTLPLSYGPVLWAPYLVPHLLHLDLRFLSLAGVLIAAAALALSGTARALRSDWVGALGLLLAAFVWLWAPAQEDFIYIAHTPVYWPLIVLWAVQVRRGAGTGSSVSLGLLIAARTTMIALVPLYLLHLAGKNVRVAVKQAGVVAATGIAVFLPFLLLDARQLFEGLLFHYFEAVRKAVWPHPETMDRTFGLAGPLVHFGWESAIFWAQLGMWAVLIFLCRNRVKTAPALIAWSSLSLLVFSLGAIWPVYYIFLDVVVLMIAGIATTILYPWPFGVRRSVLLGAVFLLVPLLAAVAPLSGHGPEITPGRPSSRAFLLNGFTEAPNPGTDAARPFLWTLEPVAQVNLLRGSWSGAAIRIECRSQSQTRGPGMTVRLNGYRLGCAEIGPGWHTVVFSAPRRTWIAGANTLEIRVADSAGPAPGSAVDIPRPATVQLARIRVTHP